jgi:hypothetical protein
VKRPNLFILTRQALYGRLLFMLGLLVFKCVLDLGYIHFVSPLFGYAVFLYNPNVWKVLESYLVLVLFALILPFRIRKPSEFFVVFLFLFVAVPLLSIYGLKDEAREYLYMVLSSFLVLYIIIHFPKIRIRKPPKGRLLAIALSLGVLIVVFVWITVRGGFSYLNFDLLRVYEFRTEVAAIVFPGLMSYVKIWYAKVINIVLLVYFLWKRYYVALAVIMICQVVYFGVTAHKAFLFYPLLVLFAYFFVQWRYVVHALVYGLAALSGVVLLFYWVGGETLPASLLLRRVFFVTANNHFTYYHFFSESGFIYMSNNALSFLSSYPYEYPVPRIISLFQYGHADTWVNTGFLATSYMHFGFVGMLVFSVVAGLIFKLIDGLTSERVPLWVGVAIMIVPVFSLTSADLPTTIVSHGLGLALLFLWLLGGRGTLIFGSLSTPRVRHNSTACLIR